MSEPLLFDYLYYLETAKCLSPNTVSAYYADLTSYLNYLTSKSTPPQLINATEHTIMAYIASIKDSHSATSVRRHIASIKMFYLYLTDRRIIVTNPAAVLDPIKIEQKLPKVLRAREVTAILAQPTNFRDAAILELLYSAGLRVSELIALKVSDVTRDWVKCISKGSKERIIPLGKQAANKITRYLAVRRHTEEDYLFVNYRGGQLSRVAIFLMVKRYARQAGIDGKVSPHTFRHSFATHLLDGGADLRSVQEMLGHTKVSTTQLYTRVETVKLRAVHGKFHPRGH